MAKRQSRGRAPEKNPPKYREPTAPTTPPRYNRAKHIYDTWMRQNHKQLGLDKPINLWTISGLDGYWQFWESIGPMQLNDEHQRHQESEIGDEIVAVYFRSGYWHRAAYKRCL